MNRQKLITILCCAVLAAVFTGGSAWAGGISLYEFGSPDVGLAAAGYAARAQDASTVFTNPAGMSRLEKSQVLGGLQALYGNVQFSPNSATTNTGDDGGVAVGWIPGGSAFVVQKLNPKWSVGFGVLSYFGLSENYGDTWVGRYYAQNGTLIGMTLTPAVSYKVNDWLYLGAGANIMYGYIKSSVAINNAGESRPDGQMNYSDREWGYGGNFGLLVEPKPGTRFGLTYLTEVKLDFSAAPTFTGLGPILEALLTSRGLTTNPLEMKITVPQMVMFSAYHELNRQWAVMGNVGWQDWSKFGQVDIGINTSNPTSLTTASKFDDTWHVALGVQYLPAVETKWTITAGVAYDSSAVNDENRSVTLPMGEAWRFALGAQYAVTPNLSVGGAYELLWIGDMSVNQNRGPLAGTIAGSYDNSSISVFALNLKWTY
jgi:long-chain fatty acid transport protein